MTDVDMTSIGELIQQRFGKPEDVRQLLYKFSRGHSDISLSQFNQFLKSLDIQPSVGTQRLFTAMRIERAAVMSIDRFMHTIEMQQRKEPVPRGHILTYPYHSKAYVHDQDMEREGCYYVSGLKPSRELPDPAAGPAPMPGDARARVARAGGKREKFQMLYERTPPQPLDLSAVVLERVRKAVRQRAGANGLATLAKLFTEADADHNFILSIQELDHAFSRLGLNLDHCDLELLVDAVGANSRGMTISDFLAAIRGPVSQRRLDFISAAFADIDEDFNGCIEMDELKRYNPKKDPDVMAGRVNERDALPHLLSQFSGKAGIVTRKEFVDYYKNVSATIDHDHEFENLLRDAWSISGHQLQHLGLYTAKLNVTTATGAQKIVFLNDPSVDVKNRPAVMKQLRKQGIANVADYKVVSAADNMATH